MTNESHDTSDDQALIARCATGSATAWDEFVRRYRHVIQTVAQAVRARQGAWRIEVDDMVGHVYESLLKNDCKRLLQWRGEASFRTFLVHLTNNACIDYLRVHNKGREVAMPDDCDGPQIEPQVESSQPDDDEGRRRVALLREAVKMLSSQQAIIIRMRLQEIPLRDIARTLGLPPGTVFAQSSRAIVKMRKAMLGTSTVSNRDRHE